MFEVFIKYILIPFILTNLTIKILKPYLRKYLMDFPNHRSSHNDPKPTGGGLSFVLVSTFCMVYNNYYLPLFCLPLAISGFVDDFRNTNFKVRYLIQFLTGLLIIYQSNYFLKLGFENNPILLLICYLFLAFCITSIINFSNFVDGIDGLLSSCFLVLFIIASIKTNISILVIVSSVFAFIIWNWYPSKLFMGDVGSTFLGAFYSGLIFNEPNLRASILLIMPSVPILFDAFFCVIRRFFAGEEIFKAHSLHLFQRLYQAGWSHSKISMYYCTATILVGFASLLNSISLCILLIFLTLFYGYYLDQRVAISFNNSLLKSKVKN